MKAPLYLIVLIFTGCWLCAVNGQTVTNTDSLRQALKAESLPDSQRWEALDRLATHYQERLPDSALYFAEQLYTSAETAEAQEVMAKGLKQKGDYFGRKGDYDLALEHCQRALEIWEALGNQAEIATVLGIMGNSYYWKGEYDKTLDAYQRSLNIHQSLNDLFGIADIEWKLGVFYVYRGDYTQALDYFNRCLTFYESADQKALAAKALGGIGVIHYYQGEYALANEHHQRSLRIHEALGNQLGMARALGNIGLVYMNQDNYAKALDYYQRCQKKFELLGDQLGVAKNLANIALIYYYQKDFEQSLHYNQQCLDIFETLGNQSGIAEALYSMANNYYQQGDYTASMNHYQRSLKIRESLGDQLGIASVLEKIGDVNQSQGHPDLALDFYRKSLAILELLGDKRGIGNALLSIGQIYLEQGDYQKARRNGEKALTHARAIESLATLRDISKLLHQTYKAVGNTPQALEMYELHVQMRDSINTEENQRASIRFQFEQQALADSLANEQDKALAQLAYENQLSRQRLQLGFAGGVGLLFASLAVVLYRTNRRRKRTNQLLFTQKQEIEAKSQQNELLLKEIHHRVKNNLEIVSSLLELQTEQTEDEVAQSAMKASQSRVQSMGILHQKLYQGENLAIIEMRDYFRNLSDNLLDTFDASETVEVKCEMVPLELDIDTAVPIGLIVNELITNSLKYAFPEGKKGRIYISLKTFDDKYLKLIVADNGIGKPTSSTAKGTGFGTQLISLLTRQLEGSMREDHSKGTKMHFKLKRAI